MSTDAQLRLERVRRIVTEAEEHGDIFTPTELEILLEDAKAIYTKESATLIEILITRQLPAARTAMRVGELRAIPPKLETFEITDADVAAIVEAEHAERG